MCGVGAVFSRDGSPVNPSELSLMNKLMSHRGPDGSGVLLLNNGALGLAHTRLAINDQAHGHQPMVDEEAELSLSYNGEIYDCDRLRAQLRLLGHQFKTSTDTEVVLKLYRAYGLNMFEHMNGEFAFLLWDNKKKKLLAARDRFGIKPLYFLQTSKCFSFASEKKPLLALEQVPFQASHDYLLSSFMGSFIGHESFFEGIKAVKAGHFLLLDEQGLKEVAYWQPDYSTKTNISFEEAKITLSDLLKQAVERRLVADTEVGSYLSGGVDSSIITSLAAETHPDLKTFSIGFHGADFDESQLAKQTAESLNLPSSILMAGKHELASGLLNSLKHIEIPISSPQPVGMTLLSKHIRDSGIKTCITGDGSDEWFAGYAYFKLDQLRSLERKEGKQSPELKKLYQQFYRKEQGNKVLLWFPCDNWQDYTFQDSTNNREYISSYGIRYHAVSGLRQKLFNPEINAKQENMHDQIHQYYSKLSQQNLSGLDFNRALSSQQLSHYIFPMQSDRVQMSHSIEGRLPFLDKDVVEFAQTLPADYLLNLSQLQEKHLLHETFKDKLPAHMRFKHKQAYHSGFSWDDFSKNKQGKGIWEHYLSYSNIKDSGIYNALFVKTLKQINRYAPNHSDLKCKTDLLLGNVFTSLVLLDQLKPENLKPN
tara:strand:- start:1975 stop:3927 length:1953 start_codon:yes stop_codon:yes gene_type:complete